jgi:hypothetical protein
MPIDEPGRRGTPPSLISLFCTWVECTPEELAAQLELAPWDLAEYSRHGAPVWLRYALLGLALGVYHLPLHEASRITLIPLPEDSTGGGKDETP